MGNMSRGEMAHGRGRVRTWGADLCYGQCVVSQKRCSICPSVECGDLILHFHCGANGADQGSSSMSCCDLADYLTAVRVETTTFVLEVPPRRVSIDQGSTCKRRTALAPKSGLVVGSPFRWSPMVEPISSEDTPGFIWRSLSRMACRAHRHIGRLNLYICIWLHLAPGTISCSVSQGWLASKAPALERANVEPNVTPLVRSKMHRRVLSAINES